MCCITYSAGRINLLLAWLSLALLTLWTFHIVSSPKLSGVHSNPFSFSSMQYSRILMMHLCSPDFLQLCSRMGKASVAFGPYSKQQMIDIVKDRLRDLPGVIEDRAVDFVARRVAAVSGDVRRTLALLRYAVVLWQAAPKPEKCVTMALAAQAAKAVFEATHMRVWFSL
jgi:hypothetical protein